MIYELIGYVNQVGMRLEGFKQVRDNVWNARCPVCGDSEKRKGKRRFYIHLDKQKTSLIASCRNCSYANSFLYFMKDFHNDLYLEATFELFKNKAENKPVRFTKTEVPEIDEPEVINVIDHTQLYETLDCVPENNPVRRYVKSRYIYDHCLSRLGWCENFRTFSQQFDQYEDSSDMPEDVRLLIPFFNQKGEITHIQARAIDPNAYIRYITLKIDERAPKWFGVEQLKSDFPTYVIEGPIDSLFIPNCVATADANLLSYPDGDIYIPDNQYRNKEIVNIVNRVIESGKSVVLFPNDFKYKDINDAIISGLPIVELYRIIKRNTFSGMQAKLEWSTRHKVGVRNGNFKRSTNNRRF
ncbi:DNA primase subunit [Acinetobacter phage SH-Ab 15599]|nr:DNA primase subunit [Acinetobacter phage SH-Ab 15599]